MVKRQYIPDRGDIVWLEFNPQAGHEQKGIRPALTLPPALYNGKVGIALMCPITKQIKGYPFEVTLSGVSEISGVILANQIKSLAWQTRKAEFICKVKPSVVAAVQEKIQALII